jgi:hypothetical protein
MPRTETGSSLAGLLLVVLILGVMAAIAVAGTSMLVPGGAGVPSMTLPAGPTTTSPTVGTSGQMTAIGLARQAACHADYDAVVAADEAMYSKTGFFADTIQALVEAGYLRAVPSSSNGYTIGLSYATVDGRGRANGLGTGGGGPTGGITVSGVVGPGACDAL